jgi:hypothetical protein
VFHHASLQQVNFTPKTSAERRLVSAWKGLSSIRVWNSDLLAALLVVLSSTVAIPSDAIPGPLPLIGLEGPRRIRPTAAHPRAFHGTTYKPPKEKTPAPIDLRPYLVDRGSISEILNRLQPYWTDAINELNRLDVDVRGLPAPEYDPYAVVHHKTLQPVMLPDLDAGFRTSLLPALRGCAWAGVERVLRLYHRLSLNNDPNLLALTATMLSGRDAAIVSGWGEILLNLSPDLRGGVATLLLRTGALSVDSSSLAVDIAGVIEQLNSGPDSAYRIYCALRCVASLGDVEYLLQGFRLSDRLYRERTVEFAHTFHNISYHGRYPEAEVDRIIAHTDGTTDFEPWTIAAIWTACGCLDGFGAYLADRYLTQWPSETVWSLLHTFLIPYYADDEPDVATWHYLRSSGDVIDSALLAIPDEYRGKFCLNLYEFLRVTDVSTLTPDSIPYACAFLCRLCRAPFHPERNTANVWADLVTNLPVDLVDKALAAPDSSLQQLEKACRTKNATNNIGYGTWAITKVAPSFALAAFVQAPARLFRTSKTLGCLDPAERLNLVREFAQLPMMHLDTDLLDDVDAFAYIDEQSRGLRTPCISASLRAHYEGSRLLSVPRLAHYHAEMRLRWMRGRLECLEDAVLEKRARPYAVGNIDGNTAHALQLERNVKENRRALRKFLTAYWNGRVDYILTHSLTRAWLAKHPRLNVSVWLNGIEFFGRTEQDGEVRIHVETDPLEALKLGTYVGSCLGLGGELQCSAAANVLDINKRVLYARNLDGRVIGRQLVAYSEAEELVCFWVYPIGASDDLRSLFAEYDERFAMALGVHLYQAPDNQAYGDEEYDIACILSTGWWDDHYWNRRWDKLE